MKLKMLTSVCVASVCSAVCTVSGDLLITAVYDGPLTGGVPKGVELYVVNDIQNLSDYGLGSANNGGGTDGEEFTFPAGSATAGTFIYVTNNEVAFYDYYGFYPEYESGAMSINGDDAIELFQSGTVIDVFGDINVDGNGTPWEYLDGWAYRVDGIGANGGVFVDSDFMYSGPNAVDGCSTNATCSSVMPMGTYVAGGGGPVTHNIEQSGSTFNPDYIEVMTGDTIIWTRTGGNHTVTSGADCIPDGQFDSPLNVKVLTFEWVVPGDAPSDVPYFCTPHCTFGMVAMIAVLDGTEPDSDGDGWPDSNDNCVDVYNPDQADCNNDGVGDVCDPNAVDCNGNGTPDECENFADCNENNIPDECDLADGTLHDDNNNGYPDECELPPIALQLQEIRIDQPGADDDEYVEIRGDEGINLDGVFYIVIGDGAGGSGVVENITDLTGMVIPTGGTLLLAEDLDILGMATPDYIVNLNFENGDNVTHFLCMNFYGYLQQDLDTDDDGILDAEPWTGTIDGVRIVGDTSSDAVYTYVMDEEVGPNDDGYVPAHVYRYTSSCGSYMYGTYDPYDPDSVDSPGSENPPCPNPCPADIDGSGAVDVADILALIGGWGGNDPTHDLDDDGSVGVSDLLIIIAAWGPC